MLSLDYIDNICKEEYDNITIHDIENKFYKILLSSIKFVANTNENVLSTYCDDGVTYTTKNSIYRLNIRKDIIGVDIIRLTLVIGTLFEQLDLVYIEFDTRNDSYTFDSFITSKMIDDIDLKSLL
jgi:hypothetical protein